MTVSESNTIPTRVRVPNELYFVSVCASHARTQSSTKKRKYAGLSLAGIPSPHVASGLVYAWNGRPTRVRMQP